MNALHTRSSRRSLGRRPLGLSTPFWAPHRAWKRRRSKTGSSLSLSSGGASSPPLRPSEEEGSPIHDWGLTLPRLTEGGGGGRMMKGKIFSFSSPLLFLSAAGEKKRGGEATENPSFFPPRPRAGEEEEIIQRRRRRKMGIPDRDRRGGKPTSTLQNNRGRYTCYYFCRCRGKGRDFLACKMRWRRRGAKKTKNKETGRRRRPSSYACMYSVNCRDPLRGILPSQSGEIIGSATFLFPLSFRLCTLLDCKLFQKGARKSQL